MNPRHLSVNRKYLSGSHPFFLVMVFGYFFFCSETYAEDWPVYNHDNRRSGISAERFETPLYEHWIFISPHKPEPAWPAPAERDIWHRVPSLNPLVAYDRAFHTVVAGNKLFFGSSADDKVYALDASTGDILWSFFAGGPVRLAPVFSGGNIYFGSDDGYVYCLDAANGDLRWKYHAAFNSRVIPGNGRMISVCPVRTGVLVDDGTAYFGSGLFQREGVGLFALNARDGSELWKVTPENLSPQGYLLASKTHLYIPTGRTTPVAFSRGDGELAGHYQSPHGDGGAYALLAGDMLVSGPGKRLNTFQTQTKDRIFTFAGKFMIVTDENFYLLSDTDFTAYNRPGLSRARKKQGELDAQRTVLVDSLRALEKKRVDLSGGDRDLVDISIKELTEDSACLEKSIKAIRDTEHLWKVPVDTAFSMILAGNILFCGGDGTVTAFDAGTGKQMWSGRVTGKAYGLAAANGGLFVSTDHGTIHCFRELRTNKPRTVTFTSENPFGRDDKLSKMYASSARNIVERLNNPKGYCLVLDCGEGRLMYELAGRTDMHIIGVETDQETVTTARRNLDRAGLYGTRTSVIGVLPGNMPFTDYLANLIVCDGTVSNGSLPSTPDEIYRVLRPCGGIAFLGQPAGRKQQLKRKGITLWLAGTSRQEWKIIEEDGLWVTVERRPLPGSGEWTHMFAEPGNTATSNDMLVKKPMQLQWFGQPGPRRIIDRHHRPMASLVKDGIIFIPGSNCLMAVDAYNGANIWLRETPGSRRVGVFRDCGHVAAASDLVYIAVKNECWGLDVSSGKTVRKFTLPKGTGDEEHRWGYLAYADNLLYGSATWERAPRTGMDYDTIMGGTYWDNKPLVTSDYLFCLDRHNGTKVWDYKRGVIPHSAITISERDIYFFESTSPLALSDSDGRVRLDFMLGGSYSHLVKLDRQTGDKIFDIPVDFPFEHVMFLSYCDGVLLFVGTFNKFDGIYYRLCGFDAGSGEKLWENEYRYSEHKNGDHGEQDQHPVIIGSTVYSRPYDFNLHTGEKGTFNLDRGGHGCGTISGSAFYLFGRGGNPRMYEISDGGETSVALNLENRPGCYINMIPACGLVLVPESSSGCTCAYPIQTSMAFSPVSIRTQ